MELHGIALSCTIMHHLAPSCTILHHVVPSLIECCEKYKSFKLKIPQPDSGRRHSPDFRTVFGIMIGPFSSCEIGKTWGLQNEKKPYVKWEKARKPLSNGRKWADYLPRYHVTELISEQVSDFSFGHQKCLFWEWEKATFTAFPHFRKGTSGAWNKNLRPLLKTQYTLYY